MYWFLGYTNFSGLFLPPRELNLKHGYVVQSPRTRLRKLLVNILCGSSLLRMSTKRPRDLYIVVSWSNVRSWLLPQWGFPPAFNITSFTASNNSSHETFFPYGLQNKHGRSQFPKNIMLLVYWLFLIISSFHEVMQSRGVRRPSVRPSVCKLCANRFFYHRSGWIATKLAHDGPRKSPHPGCAQGQGQGQRSRDTDTFLPTRKSLLLPQT